MCAFVPAFATYILYTAIEFFAWLQCCLGCCYCSMNGHLLKCKELRWATSKELQHNTKKTLCFMLCVWKRNGDRKENMVPVLYRTIHKDFRQMAATCHVILSLWVLKLQGQPLHILLRFNLTKGLCCRSVIVLFNSAWTSTSARFHVPLEKIFGHSQMMHTSEERAFFKKESNISNLCLLSEL